MKSRLKLPLLAARESELEKCVYCPKLCRAVCPVGNVEASETLTPWGKMSLAYFAARGDFDLDRAHADTAWACTGCLACRERCEHKNEVAQVLGAARAEFFAAGLAPAGAVAVAASWPERSKKLAASVAVLCRDTGTALAPAAPGAGGAARQSPARTALLVGCSYARHALAEARAIVALGRRFGTGAGQAGASHPLALVPLCCGLPLLQAGARGAFMQAAAALSETLRRFDRVIVADPGCALVLRRVYPEAGIPLPPVELLVDVLVARMGALPANRLAGRKLRYADPCKLGRGLGRYDEPRAILARLCGAPPAEMPRAREAAECSGAGGLLPATRPEASAAIAAERVAEHRELGGGTLVTACGGSLRRLRGLGTEVADLYALVASALD
ncbi:MAG: (Fe-S)-binding protein [Polyangiaceae bacterium]|nr:(Fe-S)-binding protein [Polyangiaceae bacterium]